MMKTKSFPVRSCRKSLHPYPPLPERFGSRDIDPDTVRPHMKRQSPLWEDIGGSELVKYDACIVCEVSDERVSRCCGVGCLLRFHGECLTPEIGGSEDLANPFCPYCWFKFVSLKPKSLRDKSVCAEKSVYKYLEKGIVSGQGLQGERAECSSKEYQFDNNSHQPEKGTNMEEDKVIEHEVEASAKDDGRVAADNVQDAMGDDESAQVRTKVNQGTGRKKVFWSLKEEQILKMGVEKFGAEANKNIPWRKILEMGEGVFHRTRIAAHLKDKWRKMNMAQH